MREGCGLPETTCLKVGQLVPARTGVDPVLNEIVDVRARSVEPAFVFGEVVVEQLLVR